MILFLLKRRVSSDRDRPSKAPDSRVPIRLLARLLQGFRGENLSGGEVGGFPMPADTRLGRWGNRIGIPRGLGPGRPLFPFDFQVGNQRKAGVRAIPGRLGSNFASSLGFTLLVAGRLPQEAGQVKELSLQSSSFLVVTSKDHPQSSFGSPRRMRKAQASAKCPRGKVGVN